MNVIQNLYLWINKIKLNITGVGKNKILELKTIKRKKEIMDNITQVLKMTKGDRMVIRLLHLIIMNLVRSAKHPLSDPIVERFLLHVYYYSSKRALGILTGAGNAGKGKHTCERNINATNLPFLTKSSITRRIPARILWLYPASDVERYI